MTERLRARLLGVGLVALALWLLAVGVPEGVVSPAGGPLVLRPDFWPRVLAWALLAVGLGLSARAFLGGEVAADTPSEVDAGAGDHATASGLLRLALLGAILLMIAFGADTLGMVWVAAIAFWATIAVLWTRHWPAGLVVGVVLPLLLYAFFAKFAGVPVPQGDLVRLP